MKNILGGFIIVAICGFWPGTRWIAEQAIERAVRRLPETHREAMREEWYAELDVYPGGFWTLCWALDLVRGASTLAIELEQAEASQTEAKEAAEATEQQEEAPEPVLKGTQAEVEFVRRWIGDQSNWEDVSGRRITKELRKKLIEAGYQLAPETKVPHSSNNKSIDFEKYCEEILKKAQKSEP